jgi:3-dehydroquinate dehydratase
LVNELEQCGSAKTKSEKCKKAINSHHNLSKKPENKKLICKKTKIKGV